VTAASLPLRLDPERLADAFPSLVWIEDAAGRLVFCNRRWTEYTGMGLADARGDGWLDAVHPDDRPSARARHTESLRTGEIFEQELRLRRSDGEYRWFAANATAVRDGGTVLFRIATCMDIHDRKRADRLLRFFGRAGRALGASLEPSDVARTLATLLVPELADACQIYGYADDELRVLASAHTDPLRRAVLEEIAERWPAHAAGDAVRAAMLRGEPIVISCVDDGLRKAVARDREHYDALRRLGSRSVAIVPLLARGEPCGVLVLCHGVSGRRYGEDDLPILQEIARRGAVALDNAQRYQREHRIATVLQEAVLPRTLPNIPGVRLYALYVPAVGTLRVGGDWYDAFVLPGNRLGLSIGDVTGHGLEAAVVMGEIRQSLRSSAIESPSPAAVLDHADRILSMQRPETIATAGFAIFDPIERTLTYAGAGHPPPLIASPGGGIVALRADGLPLGMREPGSGETVTTALERGSLVVFYTDGLIEFDRDAIRGERLLYEALARERLRPSDDPARALFRGVVGRSGVQDDVALLVLSVE